MDLIWFQLNIPIAVPYLKSNHWHKGYIRNKLPSIKQILHLASVRQKLYTSCPIRRHWEDVKKRNPKFLGANSPSKDSRKDSRILWQRWRNSKENSGSDRARSSGNHMGLWTFSNLLIWDQVSPCNWSPAIRMSLLEEAETRRSN